MDGWGGCAVLGGARAEGMLMCLTPHCCSSTVAAATTE